jgi:hypothetical protein
VVGAEPQFRLHPTPLRDTDTLATGSHGSARRAT